MILKSVTMKTGKTGRVNEVESWDELCVEGQPRALTATSPLWTHRDIEDEPFMSLYVSVCFPAIRSYRWKKYTGSQKPWHFFLSGNLQIFFFLIETRHKAGMEKKQKTKRRDDSEALMMIGLLCDQQEWKNILTCKWVLMRKKYIYI